MVAIAKASASSAAMQPMKDVASMYLDRWSQMKTNRQTWMTQWDAVARYCCPRKGNILTKLSPGQAQTIDLYDTTAEQAGGVFAAGCVTHICPAGEKWLRLEAKGKDAPPSVAEWYDKCTDKLTDRLYDSNFYEGIHEDFFDAGHFGTSSLFEDEDPEQLFNFINIPVGTFAIEEDCRGHVDTVGREWQWTVRQAEQKWGREKLGKTQRDVLESNDPTASTRKFTYVHFVEPRKNSGYDGVTPVIGNKRPFRSMYLCVEDQQVIEEGGYYSMPYFTGRLLRSNQEVYGRGPGIQSLPDIRLVNAMMRDYLIAVEKMVNPGWLLGDDQSVDLDNRPNGKSYWDTSIPNGKPEQLHLQNDVKWAKDMIDEQRETIRTAYYVPLFQMLTNMEEAKREKTAYEVQQMVAEQLLHFSPLFGRLTREKLNPCIGRSFDIMCRASHAAWAAGIDGVLPLPPPEMRDFSSFKVVYVSKIALAIKAAENQSFATMMTLIEQAAAIDPNVVHILNMPEGIRRVARNIGTPSALIRTEREANGLAQAAAAERAKAAAPMQSELSTRALKNLGPQAQEAAARKVVQSAGQAA